MDADDGHGEATPARLRGLARELDGTLNAGRAPFPLRPGQRVLGEIPSGDGLVLRVLFSPSHHSGNSCLFIQVFRLGPDGALSTASGSIRIDSGVLPGFAAAIATGLELATDRTRDQ